MRFLPLAVVAFAALTLATPMNRDVAPTAEQKAREENIRQVRLALDEKSEAAKDLWFWRTDAASRDNPEQAMAAFTEAQDDFHNALDRAVKQGLIAQDEANQRRVHLRDAIFNMGPTDSPRAAASGGEPHVAHPPDDADVRMTSDSDTSSGGLPTSSRGEKLRTLLRLNERAAELKLEKENLMHLTQAIDILESEKSPANKIAFLKENFEAADQKYKQANEALSLGHEIRKNHLPAAMETYATIRGYYNLPSSASRGAGNVLDANVLNARIYHLVNVQAGPAQQAFDHASEAFFNDLQHATNTGLISQDEKDRLVGELHSEFDVKSNLPPAADQEPHGIPPSEGDNGPMATDRDLPPSSEQAPRGALLPEGAGPMDSEIPAAGEHAQEAPSALKRPLEVQPGEGPELPKLEDSSKA